MTAPMKGNDMDLPEITDAVLDQWERSARADAEAGTPWATNPLAILAAIRDLREARTALARVEALCSRRYGDADATDFLIDDIRAALIASGAVRPEGEAQAEAWERGHFYCAAEEGDKRCRNPYRAALAEEGGDRG